MAEGGGWINLMKAFSFSVIGRLVAAAFLLWALDRHVYSYYVLLRWLTCAVAVYTMVIAVRMRQREWSWMLGGIAAIFNPLLIVHLDRATWAIIDIVAGTMLVLSLYCVRELPKNERAM